MSNYVILVNDLEDPTCITPVDFGEFRDVIIDVIDGQEREYSRLVAILITQMNGNGSAARSFISAIYREFAEMTNFQDSIHHLSEEFADSIYEYVPEDVDTEYAGYWAVGELIKLIVESDREHEYGVLLTTMVVHKARVSGLIDSLVPFLPKSTNSTFFQVTEPMVSDDGYCENEDPEPDEPEVCEKRVPENPVTKREPWML